MHNIIKFQNGKTSWDVQNLYDQRNRVQDAVAEIRGGIKCESGNVEMQWKSIKK
jgi:hypothetical protein